MTRPAPEDVKTVAVVGTGTIGASWVAYFLAQGCDVVAVDPGAEAEQRLQADVAVASAALDVLGIAGAAPGGEFRFRSAVDDALSGVSFVQENAPEDIACKRALYDQLEEVLDPSVVIASSTSSLLCSELQTGARYPGRFIVAHPMNPPHLLPLVEVVAGARTETATVAWALAFYAAMGRRPIHVRKERIGHLANRLTSALYREAVNLVAEGVASVEDVDKAIALGPGLRWAVMGPHMLYHLAAGDGGYAAYLAHLGASQEARWRDLGTPHLTPELQAELVEGVLAEAHGASISELRRRRDQALIAILKQRLQVADV